MRASPSARIVWASLMIWPRNVVVSRDELGAKDPMVALEFTTGSVVTGYELIDGGDGPTSLAATTSKVYVVAPRSGQIRHLSVEVTHVAPPGDAVTVYVVM